MSLEYVLALDEGTTSVRAILFSSRAQLVCSHALEITQYHSPGGRNEQDPIEILEQSKTCIDECIKIAEEKHGITIQQIKAIGIANQRETTVVWDRNTGLPLYRAIVWRDTRTHDTCHQLRAQYGDDRIRRISGLPISTYFSGVKLRWLIDNIPPVAEGIANGSALFGTIDTWLTWNLSREQAHVTDVTNAGRTMLMNINTLEWDDELLSIIGIDRSILPEIRSCSEEFGHMADTKLKGVPISGLIGDQQAALVGQSCFKVGEAKVTYGTGCFLIVNTGLKPKFSAHKLLTTPAYKFGDEDCVYSLEGSIATAGSAVKWLIDGLEMINSPREIEALAAQVKDTAGVYFVPAFSGLLAPWWREDARGTLLGLTEYTSKAHIARAVLEGIAFQVIDVLKAACLDTDASMSTLKVDGGAAENDLLLQTEADLIGAKVVRPKILETTALGAAFAAGRAVGVFQSSKAFAQHWRQGRKFEPKIAPEARARRLKTWEKAVQKSFNWVDEVPDQFDG